LAIWKKKSHKFGRFGPFFSMKSPQSIYKDWLVFLYFAITFNCFFGYFVARCAMNHVPLDTTLASLPLHIMEHVSQLHYFFKVWVQKTLKKKLSECGRWLVITTIVTNPHTKRWAFVCIVASDIKLRWVFNQRNTLFNIFASP